MGFGVSILGYQVFGEAQVMECLLQDLGGVLRLTAVTLQALLRFQATTLAGFGVFFHGSFAWGHGEGLRSVGTFVRLK
jgi:hypothetical protein